MAEPFDLDGTCGGCGKPLRHHCDSCKCRLLFTWCEGMIRRYLPGVWEEMGGELTGICRYCGQRVYDHFRMGFMRIRLDGEPPNDQEPSPYDELQFRLPLEFIDCRERKGADDEQQQPR